MFVVTKYYNDGNFKDKEFSSFEKALKWAKDIAKGKFHYISIEDHYGELYATIENDGTTIEFEN